MTVNAYLNQYREKDKEHFMYRANELRYKNMQYNRVGESGLKLPAVSLGFWHNFGETGNFNNMKSMCFTAFDMGITHFDLANNYGPAEGAAESNLGRIMREELRAYRDELIISTKAGYYMWSGPYGDGGSRKYLIASLDASLKRMGLEYVDIFYHHRMDPDTPLEETMQALSDIVHSGKALYVGLSNYNGERMREASAILRALHCPFIINQNRYSMLDRTVEKNGLLDASRDEKKGVIAFSPLEQGWLGGRYLFGIPRDSRVRTDGRFLNESQITPERIHKIQLLTQLSEERGESLSQMALSWLMARGKGTVVSVLVGASRPQQIRENAGMIHSTPFTEEELKRIETIVNG